MVDAARVAPAAPDAEMFVISGFMARPGQIPNYPEVTDLIFTYDHQLIWRAMRQMDTTLTPGDFAYELLDVLRARHPRESDRLWERIVSQEFVVHSWSENIERLEKCALARRLINTAQEIAERAWRLDNDGALRIIQRW